MEAKCSLGYKNLTNIDISSVCIQQMKERCASMPEIKCMESWKGMNLLGEVMDVCHMTFPDQSFDFIFDKGTLDAILCGENDQKDCQNALKEVIRYEE